MPIEFALFAPYNETVELVGDFSSWKPLPMTKGADGWWRTELPLPDGDHQYKFRVKSLSYFAMGETLELFDPYSLHVSNDDHENSIVRVVGGERVWTTYEWRHDDVPLPPNDELVIYELFVGDFAGTSDRRGTFADVVAKLDDLKALGVNALELMPVKFFPKGQGWGYNLRSLFGVASNYGTPDDLCRLVDECHARGMRVVMDGVYNHADADSPLAKIAYGYWYYEKNPDPPEMQWGPKFNYGHYDSNLDIFPARKYVIDSIRFWVEKFHVDGIRFDATRAIANFDAMKELTKAGFAAVDGRKPFFTVAEHVPEDPAITAYPDGPMVAAWRFSLGARFRAVLTEHDNDGQSPADFEGFIDALDPRKDGYRSGVNGVNYIVSHDHDRLMHQLGDTGHMFGDVAFARVKLGLGILATIPGVPMIWMGQEFGAASEKSLEPRPLDWSLLGNQRNSQLRDHVRGLFQLRHRMPALRSDEIEVCFRDPARRVFAYKRWNGDGNVIVVAVNLKHEPSGEIVVGECGLEDGQWHEHTSNYDRAVDNGVLRDELGPSEVKIFFKTDPTQKQRS
ncbi:MAG TPA: alpha-amylase family glycosyl hydrolase [Polyangia bacterium]|nr:alpha-amylase family glycosyl hydrolase [Polyangia bacterium]